MHDQDLKEDRLRRLGRERVSVAERAAWVVVVLVLVGAAGYFYFQRQSAQQPSTVSKPVAVQPSAPKPVPQDEPGIRYPVEVETPAKRPDPERPPPPPLNGSDTAALEQMVALFGAGIQQFLVPQDLIRRIVSTIDNLPRDKIAVRIWPVAPAAGKFRVSGGEEEFTLEPENYERYSPFVELVTGADAQSIVAAYRYFYPRFQQAYEELGYPSRYFNDRLVAVIDHLLETPDAPQTVTLVRPAVYYRFADPDLESRSAGQKILLRMGNAHAAAIKDKLREIREQLVGAEPAR